MFVKTLSGALWAVSYPAGLLPLGVLYLVGTIAFFVGYYIFSYRRTVVVQNLSRSFPQMKYGEIKSVSKGFSRHFFDICAEWVKLRSASNEELSKRIKFSNLELLKQYNDEGKSVILVMGHFGNWEYLNLLPLHIKQPVYAVYKKLSNPVINNVSARLRMRFGVQLLESREASKFVLCNRNNPSCYIFIADQSPTSQSKECYEFLNQPTTAFAGVEKLAAAINAAVVYVEIMPSSRGNYNISFTQIDPSTSVTAQFLSELEKSINKSPKYWLWSHRRWKHNVEVAPSPTTAVN